MTILSSFFLTSTISVRENVVKNILFRVAALLLQLSIYKSFSYIAFQAQAYTSFLMFAEDTVQKLFFIFSRGCTKQALILLGFAALFAAAGFYDTLLWALDSPGYVSRSSVINATSVAYQMLANPSYNIPVADPDQNVESINIDEAITGNLYKSGFNFTLPGTIAAGVRDVVSTNRSFSETGPRIWLDDDGFSVGVDQTTMIAQKIEDFCPIQTADESTQVWKCEMNNTQALVLFSSGNAGRVEIWWDLERDNESEFLTPNRQDNPWVSLGTGGDTAAMKQVFTVTKGRRRHTFLETVLKVSMLTPYPIPFNDTEITETVRRMWSVDSTQPITPGIQSLADLVVSAQANQTTLTFGSLVQTNNYSVSSSYTELLNVLNAADIDDHLYSVLRTTSTNITLIRSETLPDPVVPFAPCPGFYFTNIATGGKVRSTTCHEEAGNQTGATANGHFQGQLDTSSMLILTDVLGDGSTSTSATALNQTGLDWLMRNNDRMDQLLTSRGLILGGDRAAVAVEVKHNEAAMSYLQLFLVLFPVLSAIMAFVLVISGPTSYYRASFLAAVCATTHVSDSKCSKVGYLRVPPEISLRTSGEHVLIGTPSGVLTNVGHRGESAYIMSAEQLIVKHVETPMSERDQWRGT